MNTQDFTYLIQHPKNIDKEQTKQLEDVIATFPYFQSARALYLKGLKNQDSFRYNQTLKTTAAYTTDRSILFDFITSSIFTNNTIKTENIDVIDVESIEVIHKKLEKPTKTSEEIKVVEEVLKIGKPIEFKNTESHSFNEWLQLSTFTLIKREKKSTKTEEKFDLVDKFIAKNPKIKPVQKTDSNLTPLNQEPTDYETLMTETLARVYLEQKKYKNAISAYRILSLKYPEKSSFFANRIKAIKILDKK